MRPRLLIIGERVQEIHIALLAEFVLHTIEGVETIGPSVYRSGLPGRVSPGLTAEATHTGWWEGGRRRADGRQRESVDLCSSGTGRERTGRHVHHFKAEHAYFQNIRKGYTVHAVIPQQLHAGTKLVEVMQNI